MSDETFFLIDLAVCIILSSFLHSGPTGPLHSAECREYVAVLNPKTKFGTVTSSPPGYQRHLGLGN